MKTANILGFILVLQVLLASGLAWRHYAVNDDGQPQPLLDFDTSQVDRIVIDDNDNQVVLAKTGDTWTLPELYILDANQTRVTGLLDSLSGLKTGWPVADTKASIERLEVDDDKYQRKLQLISGDRVLGEYFFGTSPGLRQTHGRRSGEDEVYALAINNFDMPGDANDWIDKTKLSLTEVERIAGPDYMLTKKDDTWRLDHLDNANEMLDESRVSDMVSALKSLRVLRVADTLPEEEPVTFTFGDMEMSWTYSFYKDEDTYYLKRSDMDAGFTISKSTYDRIAGVSRDGLLIQEQDSDEKAADEAAV